MAKKGGNNAQSLDLPVRALDFDVLGKQPPEDLPDLATEALVGVVDSPSLRELAGTSPRDYQEARDLFRSAMSELGVAVPTEEEALWRCVRHWARDMLDGTRPARSIRSDLVAGVAGTRKTGDLDALRRVGGPMG